VVSLSGFVSCLCSGHHPGQICDSVTSFSFSLLLRVMSWVYGTRRVFLFVKTVASSDTSPEALSRRPNRLLHVQQRMQFICGAELPTTPFPAGHSSLSSCYISSASDALRSSAMSALRKGRDFMLCSRVSSGQISCTLLPGLHGSWLPFAIEN
jgi:hypothetical protein